MNKSDIPRFELETFAQANFKLYEAKSLLIQTDWDIRTISYVLGFTEHGSFTSLFHKKESIPPSRFRENATMV